MASFKYFSTPGRGDYAKENYHYSEAVKVGDTLQLSGQGGGNEKGEYPTDLKSQIHNSFTSISSVIKYALPDQNLENGWEKVFRVTSYHVNLRETDKEVLKEMVGEMKKWCPGHSPIWTLVGVERLALPQMQVEIEVMAHIG